MPHARACANAELACSRWAQLSVSPARARVWALCHPLICAMKAMNELKQTMNNFTKKPPGMCIPTGLSFWLHLPFENTSWENC